MASYSQYLTGQPRLPSYARVADSLDHVLRICSRLRELLFLDITELDKEETKEEIINKAKALVYVLQRSAYAFHLFDKVKYLVETIHKLSMSYINILHFRLTMIILVFWNVWKTFLKSTAQKIFLKSPKLSSTL